MLDPIVLLEPMALLVGLTELDPNMRLRCFQNEPALPDLAEPLFAMDPVDWTELLTTSWPSSLVGWLRLAGCDMCSLAGWLRLTPPTGFLNTAAGLASWAPCLSALDWEPEVRWKPPPGRSFPPPMRQGKEPLATVGISGGTPRVPVGHAMGGPVYVLGPACDTEEGSDCVCLVRDPGSPAPGVGPASDRSKGMSPRRARSSRCMDHMDTIWWMEGS